MFLIISLSHAEFYRTERRSSPKFQIEMEISILLNKLNCYDIHYTFLLMLIIIISHYNYIIKAHKKTRLSGTFENL